MIILIKLCLKEAETFIAAEDRLKSLALKPAHSRGEVLPAMAGKRGQGEEARISTLPDLLTRRRLIVRWNVCSRINSVAHTTKKGETNAFCMIL